MIVFGFAWGLPDCEIGRMGGFLDTEVKSRGSHAI